MKRRAGCRHRFWDAKKVLTLVHLNGFRWAIMWTIGQCGFEMNEDLSTQRDSVKKFREEVEKAGPSLEQTGLHMATVQPVAASGGALLSPLTAITNFYMPSGFSHWDMPVWLL